MSPGGAALLTVLNAETRATLLNLRTGEGPIPAKAVDILEPTHPAHNLADPKRPATHPQAMRHASHEKTCRAHVGALDPAIPLATGRPLHRQACPPDARDQDQ